MTLLKGPYESLLFAFKVVVKGLSAGNIKVGIFLIMKLKGQDCSLGFFEKKKKQEFHSIRAPLSCPHQFLKCPSNNLTLSVSTGKSGGIQH